MIKLRKAVNGEFYIIITAANGEELYKSSETYKQRAGALNSVHSLARVFKSQFDMHLFQDETQEG